MKSSTRQRSAIIAAALTLVATVATAPTAQAGVFMAPPCPRVAVVGNLVGGTASIVDLKSDSVIRTITGITPFGSAVSRDGRSIYLTTFRDNGVAVIDVLTLELDRTIDLGYAGTSDPNGVAVNRTATRLYVANSTKNTVSVIDLSTDAVITQVAVGANPTGVAVARNGLVYVSNYGAGSVSVINPVDNSVAATITVGSNPVGIDGSNVNRVFVANSGSGTMSVIDTRTNTVVRTVTLPAGATPESLAVENDLVAVSNLGTGGVVVYDTSTLKIKRQIAVDGTWGIDITSNKSVIVTRPAGGDAVIYPVAKSAPSTSVSTGSVPLGLGHFIAEPEIEGCS